MFVLNLILILILIYFQTGHTALQRAAAEGHSEVVLHLLERGSPVDHQDEVVRSYFCSFKYWFWCWCCFSFVFVAVVAVDDVVLIHLLERGSPVDHQDEVVRNYFCCKNCFVVDDLLLIICCWWIVVDDLLLMICCWWFVVDVDFVDVVDIDLKACGCWCSCCCFLTIYIGIFGFEFFALPVLNMLCQKKLANEKNENIVNSIFSRISTYFRLNSWRHRRRF